MKKHSSRSRLQSKGKKVPEGENVVGGRSP